MLSSSARYIIAIAALLSGALAAADRFAAIPNGWAYRVAAGTAWRKLSEFDRAEVRNHPGLWLRRNLPDIGARNTVLVFIGFTPRLSVYVDTALIYDYNNSSGRLTHVATIHTNRPLGVEAAPSFNGLDEPAHHGMQPNAEGNGPNHNSFHAWRLPVTKAENDSICAAHLAPVAIHDRLIEHVSDEVHITLRTLRAE